MNQPSLPRVAAVATPDEYVLPARPAGVGPTVLDAFRQTQFVLGGDLDLFAEAMNLQLRLVRESRPPQYRTHALAALAAFWSRAYTQLSDAMLLVMRASYASTLPLVRSSCELIAAQIGLLGGEMEEHEAWLTEALKPDERFKAVEVGLGRYYAGGAIARDDVLGGVFRPATEFTRPNFGPSLLETGPESNQRLITIAFDDGAFHLGWAEIVLGWLLALSARQLRVAVESPERFVIAADARAQYEALQKRVDAALSRDDRCRVEEVRDANDRRYLIHNFRRGSGTAPKRFLL
ncbi:MAG TPA: hypothetical protein VI759_00135 [Dehalococcoidia bacterium]|nr:hypothetical protein [Dehalococcoidia bacterium]